MNKKDPVTVMVCGEPAQDVSLELDKEQLLDLYDTLNDRILSNLEKFLNEGKIDGNEYVKTWAGISDSLIGSLLNSMTALATKETPTDRAVKCEGISSSQSTTRRNDTLADDKIYNDDRLAEDNIYNSDRSTDSEINVRNQQIEASEAKTTRDDSLAVSKISVDDEQITSSEATTTRNDELATETITASGIKSDNETCVSNADCALKGEQQKKVLFETTKVLPQNVSLSLRQEQGFDDNINMKLFEAQNAAWSMMFSSGLLGSDAPIPAPFNSGSAGDLYDHIANTTGAPPSDGGEDNPAAPRESRVDRNNTPTGSEDE